MVLTLTNGMEKKIRGANINAENEYGNTPLNGAINAKRMESVKLLIERSANINGKDMHGNTPLMHVRWESKGNYNDRLRDER